MTTRYGMPRSWGPLPPCAECGIESVGHFLFGDTKDVSDLYEVSNLCSVDLSLAVSLAIEGDVWYDGRSGVVTFI